MGQTLQDRSHFTRRSFLQSTSLALLGLWAVAGHQTLSLAATESNATAGNATAAESGERDPLHVVIYLYDRMTALDAIGPYEVFRLIPGSRISFAAKKAGVVKPDSGLQMLNAEYAIADIDSADILIVPGGDVAAQIPDQEVLQWIRDLHQKTKWTTSVCVGSLILGAAGLLKGLQATSHWNTKEGLQLFGAQPVDKRFVQQGKIITAAGVSAGMDMALWLTAKERGEELAKTIQLLIEYDPQPPFNTGSPSKAPPAMIEKAKQMLRDIYA